MLREHAGFYCPSVLSSWVATCTHVGWNTGSDPGKITVIAKIVRTRNPAHASGKVWLARAKVRPEESVTLSTKQEKRGPDTGSHWRIMGQQQYPFLLLHQKKSLAFLSSRQFAFCLFSSCWLSGSAIPFFLTCYALHLGRTSSKQAQIAHYPLVSLSLYLPFV